MHIGTIGGGVRKIKDLLNGQIYWALLIFFYNLVGTYSAQYLTIQVLDHIFFSNRIALLTGLKLKRLKRNKWPVSVHPVKGKENIRMNAYKVIDWPEFPFFSFSVFIFIRPVNMTLYKHSMRPGT